MNSKRSKTTDICQSSGVASFWDLPDEPEAEPSLTKARISKSEAKTLLKLVNKSQTCIFKLFVTIMKQNAYTVLGFKTLHACLKAYKCDLSDSYIFLSMKAAKIYLKLDPELKHLDQVSECIFRPLTRDTNEKYTQEVWDTAVENLHGDTVRRIKTLDIKAAISEVGCEATMACKPKKPALILDDETLNNVTVYAKRFSKHSLFRQFRNRSEWLAMANLINDRVMGFCPLPGEVMDGFNPRNKL